MNIQIIHRATAQVVADVPLVLVGYDYKPSEEEAFAIAWRTAVDDQLVDPARQFDYEFRAVA